MNVLIFHSQSISSFPSGEHRVAILENRELHQRGINSTLVVYKPTGLYLRHYAPRFEALSNNLWSFSAYRDIKSYIKKIKPDLVHFHGIFPYLSASALSAASATGVPVVQTLHNGRWLCLEGGFYRCGGFCNKCVAFGGWQGVRYGCKHGVFPSLMLHASNLIGLTRGRLFRWVDRFIAVSDFIREQHITAGFPRAQIVVKSNGIDVYALKKIARTRIRDGIVYIGRVSVSKGSSIIQYLASHCKATIHVVGDGPDLGVLKHFCTESGFSHVRFWGKQPHDRCFEIMASACCTIIPSQCGEAFPLVCVESLGLGTPVVASDIGGLGPLVRESGGGLTVNPKDQQGFIEAIELLLSHPEMVYEFGFRGSRYVSRHLNIGENIQELIDIYQSVLDDKRRHAHQL